MLTGKRLREYLAYAVHGRTTPPERKPPVQAKRAGTRRGPERSEKYKAFVRRFPCAACGVEGRSEAAHTGKAVCCAAERARLRVAWDMMRKRTA